jgi:hypothetical protein
LKEVACSQRFPALIVAYYDKTLDGPTLRQLQDGLLRAGAREKEKVALSLFRLTGFDPVPADFEQVLAETCKAYPAPPASKSVVRTTPEIGRRSSP